MSQFYNIRNLLLLITTISFLSACRQHKVSKLTVILFDNPNPNFKITSDTLLKAKKINFSATAIDIFFTNSNFHLPYYVPTDGIFKNGTKDKECDLKIYPGTVKCYEYDSKERVTKMTVHGSGTMTRLIYLYNDKNQITQITDNGTKFILKYNANGTFSELRQRDGVINKILVFVYE